MPGVKPLFPLAGRLVLEDNFEAGTQHGLGLEHAPQLRDRETIRVEKLGLRPEAHRRSSIFLANGTDDFELGVQPTALESDVVFLATATHPAFQMGRQGINHRDTDTMQAAGEGVVLARELATGM